MPLLLLFGCVLSVRPLSQDYSDLPPEQALDAALETLSQVYSLSAHKELDWTVLSEQVQEEADLEQSLRALTVAMPDGHVLLEHEDPERLKCAQIGGSLALTFSDSEQGVVVVSSQVAEVEPGDVLLSWQGLSVDEALQVQPLQCFPVGLATQDKRAAARVRLLSLAEVGSEIALELEGGAGVYQVALPALEHDLPAHAVLGLHTPEDMVSHRMLSPEIGYLRIGWEESVLSERRVRSALSQLYRDGARSLVLDLRDNDGGTDMAAANIVGLFTQEAFFYETITMYDRRSEGQVDISEVWVQPQELYWSLPVVVLVNDNTVSSGEGIAMGLQSLGIPIMGLSGTAASFGSTGSTTRFPDGWTLTWPAGLSLDAAGEIQLDSDASGVGGVAPDLWIPWTVENRVAYAADREGFEMAQAQAWLEAQ